MAQLNAFGAEQRMTRDLAVDGSLKSTSSLFALAQFVCNEKNVTPRGGESCQKRMASTKDIAKKES